MYKLVFIFSIVGLAVSAVLCQQEDDVKTEPEKSSENKEIFTIKEAQNGEPEQQCECKDYHECDANDFYDPSLKQSWIRCESPRICCIIRNKKSGSSPSSLDSLFAEPQKDDPNQVPSFDAAHETKEVDSSGDVNCTCVPFSRCSQKAYEEIYGNGTIGIRIQQCDISKMCCPYSELKNEGTKTGVPGEPQVDTVRPSFPSETQTEPLFSSGVSQSGYSGEQPQTPIQSVTPVSTSDDEYSPTQPPTSQCSCVALESCNNDTIKFSHGAGFLQLRGPSCEVQEVCCLVSDGIVGSVSPEPYVTNPAEPGTPSKTPSEHECGIRRNANVRVPNEDEAYTGFGEFPWMVMVLKKEIGAENPKMICGGSLIRDNMVLTAAHCVHKIEREFLIVRAGEYDSNLDPSKEVLPHQDRSVQDIRIHPFYRSDVVFNDMALLITEEPFKFDSHISPICLPLFNSKYTDRKVYDPTKCIATGWGKETHGDGGTYQNSLKKVDLSLVDHQQCERRLRTTKLGPKFLLHPSFICAGGEIGKDTCQGDGGGPLFCALRDSPDHYVQVGITSWGVSCGEKYPGVYANIYANSKWLTVEINMSTIFARSGRSNVSKNPKPKSKN